MPLLTIIEHTVCGEVFRLAEMPFGIAKKHGAEGKALLARGEAVTTEEWYERVLRTISQAIERAGDTSWTIERLENELGKPSIDSLYLKVLEISGLGTAQTGEVKAA